MSSQPPRRSVALATAVLAGIVATMGAPSALSFHGEEPLVLERTGGTADAWAVAVRSHDEPTSSKGNELFVTIQMNAPYERSVSSMGIVELEENGEGDLSSKRGVVAATFRGEDEMHVEPVGDVPDPVDSDVVRSALSDDSESALGWATERRFMDPGEWRYFVVWSGGSGSSTFQLRGTGFTVERVVEGDAHVFSNDELVAGEGIHAHESVQLPPGLSLRDWGHAGAGVTVVSDAGVSINNEDPLVGLFTDFQTWRACAHSCVPLGGKMDFAASQVRDGGFANLTIETPQQGEIAHDYDSYWLLPGPYYIPAEDPGSYRFDVDHLMDVSGPSYREPGTGYGARLDGEQVVLSLSEVDYERLEDVRSG